MANGWHFVKHVQSGKIVVETEEKRGSLSSTPFLGGETLVEVVVVELAAFYEEASFVADVVR